MELDDFKGAWLELNRKVERQTELNFRLLREGHSDRARHVLRRLAHGQVLQMILGGLLSLYAGSFWVMHRQVTHLLFTGLLMHAYGITMILAGARVQFLLQRIDFGAPVLQIQRSLTQLRRFHIFMGLVLGLPWWFLWVPAALMAFMTIFGADLAAHVPFVILLLYVVGLAGVALTLLFLRWAQGRPALAGKLERSAAGRSLNEAQRALDEIAAFERD